MGGMMGMGGAVHPYGGNIGIGDSSKRTLWVGDLKDWIDDNHFQLMFSEVANQVLSHLPQVVPSLCAYLHWSLCMD